MNKEQALERLTSLENEAKELRKIIEAPDQPTKEEKFKQLIEGWEYKVDLHKYPNSIFYFKNGKWLFEYDFKKSQMWVDFYEIWNVFSKDYVMNYDDIQLFIKGKVEEHFNLRGVTPMIRQLIHQIRVEEHFNLRGVTPAHRYAARRSPVEEHFNKK